MLDLEELMKEDDSVIDYLKRNILPFKEQFMNPWTSSVANFGISTTQRVEGAHNILKKFLDRKSNNDFYEVWLAVNKAIEEQIKLIDESLDNDTIKTLNNLPVELSPLKFKVLLVTIQGIRDQYERMKRQHDGKGCTLQSTKSLGYPCSHKIGELLARRGHLLPDDVHDQWRLDYDPEGSVSLKLIMI